jgi:hypothetical protein
MAPGAPIDVSALISLPRYGLSMGQILIRNLDDAVFDAQRRPAAEAGSWADRNRVS